MIQNVILPDGTSTIKSNYKLDSSCNTKTVQPGEKYEWYDSLRIPPLICPTANDACCVIKVNYSVMFSFFPDFCLELRDTFGPLSETKSTKLSIPIPIG